MIASCPQTFRGACVRRGGWESSGMTLLQERDAERQRQRLILFDRTREELRAVLREVLPASRVIVFGSLTRRGVFNAASDIDLALFEEPAGKSVFGLMEELEERMRRHMDVLLLEETRLKEKILREGEVWTT